MGVDPKWGRFPICPEMSRLSPFVLFFSSWGPERGQMGTKEDKQDKTGHFRTNCEIPTFRIYPHLALLLFLGFFFANLGQRKQFILGNSILWSSLLTSAVSSGKNYRKMLPDN